MAALTSYLKPFANAHYLIDEIFHEIMPKYGLPVQEEQIRLSHNILNALVSRKTVLYNTDIGTGKIYACLLAAIIQKRYLLEDWWVRTSYRHDVRFGMSTPMPVVISVSSIAFGTTICREHIPFISQVLYQSGLLDHSLTFVLRKGKGHYICDRRLRHRIRNVNLEKKNPVQRDALFRLQTGNIDLDTIPHLSSFDRKQVSVPTYCNAFCPQTKQCRFRHFLTIAMNPSIDFQVCNQHYLLADMIHRQTDKEPLLPNYRALIINEADSLFNAARQMYIPQNMIERLWNMSVPIILINRR